MSTIQTNSLQTLAGQTMNTVLQVLHQDYTTFQSFTSNDGVPNATGLSLTISPRFATSRILVICSGNIHEASNGTVVRSRVRRTGTATVYSTFAVTTNMTQYTTVSYTDTAGGRMRPNTTITWFDNPATTSACTYTLEIASNGTGQTIQLNGARGYSNTWGGISHLTLMEIAQ